MSIPVVQQDVTYYAFPTLKGSDLQLPKFLDIVEEVTSDPHYSMYTLSKREGLEDGLDKLHLKQQGEGGSNATINSTPRITNGTS